MTGKALDAWGLRLEFTENPMTNHWIELIRGGEVPDRVLYALYHELDDPIVRDYVGQYCPKVTRTHEEWFEKLREEQERAHKAPLADPFVFSVAQPATNTIEFGEISIKFDGFNFSADIRWLPWGYALLSCPWDSSKGAFRSLSLGETDEPIKLYLRHTFSGLNYYTRGLLGDDLGRTHDGFHSGTHGRDYNPKSWGVLLEWVDFLLTDI